MQFDSTPFEGLMVITPKVFGDSRGYFFESYNFQAMENAGLKYNWVQDNQSHSSYGVIRGMHFQNPPHAQTKLVRVLQGEILDVVVDVRKNQPTFGKSFSVILSSENRKQLLIPRGFAHGFSVLSETADVMYKCDALYNKESEGGLIYNDISLSIDWMIPESKANVSEKDLLLPTLDKLQSAF